jgi:hypothetical protein
VKEGSGRWKVCLVSAALLLDGDVCLARNRKHTFVIVNGFEHFLGRNQKMCHLPNGHIKVHLRPFE